MELDYEQLMQAFTAEAEEQLRAMEQGLSALERGPGDSELLASVFRAAHTLRGNAATVGLHDLAAHAELIEHSLAALRAGKVAVTPELVRGVLGTVELIRRSLRALTRSARTPDRS